MQMHEYVGANADVDRDTVRRIQLREYTNPEPSPTSKKQTAIT